MNMSEQAATLQENIRRMYKPVLVIWTVYCIAMTAVIRANVYYVDDTVRAMHGGRNWYDWGRYISEYLSPFIHTSLRLQDISPLTMLIALFFCALSAVCLSYLISGRQEMKPIQIIAAIPLAINPCFLECLTYKFDAPYMALSVLFGFLPFLFFHNRTILYAGASAFFTLCICLSYQTSVCIYPMMTAFLILTEWNRGTSRSFLLRRVPVSVLSFLTGLLLFKVLVLDSPSFLNVPGILPLREMIPGYIGNMRRYFQLLLTWQPKIWIALSGLLAAAAWFLFVKNTVQKRIPAVLLFAACLAVMLAVSFGAFAFVREPQYLPRSMYGTGILIAILSTYIASLKPDMYAWFGRGVCILLAWCFFVFAFQYGNALAEQKRYIDFRIQLVINDLIHTDVMRTEGDKYFQLSGTAGNADMLEKMNYDMVRVLTQIHFGEGDGWKIIYFKEYFDLETTAGLKLADIGTDLTQMELPLLVDTPYHRIYGAFPYVLIELLP